MLAALLSYGTAHSQPTTSCVELAGHSSLTVFLIDPRLAAERVGALRQNINLINDSTKSRERVLVNAVGDKESVTLVDITRQSGNVIQSALQLQSKDPRLKQCLGTIEATLNARKLGGKHLGVVEAFSKLSESFLPLRNGRKRLFILSDLVEASSAFASEKGNVLDPNKALETAVVKGLVPNLTDVEVYVSGIPQSGSSQKRDAAELFWKKYFNKGGATLKFFGLTMTHF